MGVLASQTVTPGGASQPFSSVSISDANVGAAEILTIVVSGGGTLSGSGVISAGGGVYSMSGSAASVTSALERGDLHPECRDAEHQQQRQLRVDRQQHGVRRHGERRERW